MTFLGAYETKNSGLRLLVEVYLKNQDLENNTSNIYWEVSAITDTAYTFLIQIDDLGIALDSHEVFRNTKFIGYTYDILASGNNTITHKEDGTKTVIIEVDGSITADAVFEDNYLIGAIVLPKIAQGAVITSAPNFTDEQSPVFTYNNPLGSKADSVRACLSFTRAVADIPYRNIPKTGSQYQFYFSQEELNTIYEYTKNKKSTEIWFIVKTYIGDKVYSSYAKRTLTIANSEPTFEYTIKDVNPNVLSITGDERVLINTLSQAQVSVYASAKKGATIEGIKIVNGKNEQVATGDLFTTVFNPVEDEVFTITVVDSRDNQITQKVKPYHFTPYYKPQFSVNDLKIDTDGNMSFYFSGKIYNDVLFEDIASGADVRNSIGIRYKYKKQGSSSYIVVNVPVSNIIVHSNGSYNTNTITVSGLSYLEIYNFVAEIYDTFTLVNLDEYSINAYPVFDWGKDDFNFNVPIKINGVQQDFTVASGKTGVWTYRQWNSGRAECYATIEVNTAISTAWGSMFVGNTKMTRQNYPIQFKSKPTEIATVQSGSNAVWLFAESGGNGVNGGYSTAIYNVCRPTAIIASGTYYISISVFGYWK